MNNLWSALELHPQVLLAAITLLWAGTIYALLWSERSSHNSN